MHFATIVRLVFWAVFAAVPMSGAAQQVAPASPPAPAAVTVPNPMPIMPPSLPPAFTVDLMTEAGVASVRGQWKNMDVKIVDAPPRPGAGTWTSSYDIQPHAGEAGFDDASWPAIGAPSLADRRGGGRLYMTWFRTALTIPERLGTFETAGATVVLTFTVDDYAEVWVNGALPRRLGRPSPATIQGFNMPNRVVLTEGVKAGDTFQVAILGINGPISVAPLNPLFVREARIDFYK